MAKTGFGNFDYVMEGTWRGQPHQFHIAANHSGSPFTGNDIATFMTGDANPYLKTFAPFQATSGCKMVAAKYYNGSDSAPVFEQFYDADNLPPDTLEPTGTAFGGTPSADAMPLEMCVMLESSVGVGKTGKPVYNRKFVRGAPLNALVASGTSSIWNFAAGAQASAATAGDGSWFNTRVYISPTGKQGNTWAALTEPGNHQVPRGRKKKTSSGGGAISNALGSALSAVELAIRAAA